MVSACSETLNQNLFNLLYNEHGLILTQSEMEDIKVAVRRDTGIKGEYICHKCGLRQSSEVGHGEF